MLMSSVDANIMFAPPLLTPLTEVNLTGEGNPNYTVMLNSFQHLSLLRSYLTLPLSPTEVNLAGRGNFISTKAGISKIFKTF